MSKSKKVLVTLSENLYNQLMVLKEQRNDKSVARVIAEIVRDYFDRKLWKEANMRLNIEYMLREIILYEVNPALMEISARVEELAEVLRRYGLPVSDRKASARAIEKEKELMSEEERVVGREWIGVKGEESEELVDVDSTPPPLPEELVEEEIIDIEEGREDYEGAPEVGGDMETSLMDMLYSTITRISEDAKELVKEDEKPKEEIIEEVERKIREKEREIKGEAPPKEEPPKEQPPKEESSIPPPPQEEEDTPLIIYDAEYPIVKGLKVKFVHVRFVMYEDGSIWDRASKRWHKTGPRLAKIRLEAGEPI